VSDSPAYRKVTDDLREQIRSGALPAGQRLQSLAELGSHYGVSRDVAREAIGVLRAEGLIETRQGSGTFVRAFARIPRVSPARLARAQWGSGKAIQDVDTGPRWRTVDINVAHPSAPPDVAEAFGIAPGEPVLSRSRRFFVDDRPVQLASSYYRLDMVRDTAIALTNTGPGGAYARLAEKGFAPDRFIERVVGRAPHPDEQLDLALSRTGRVFHITRFAYTAEDLCIEVNHMVLDADAYDLEYHFSA
jgi:GntR family transcriptional regulator